MAALTSMFTLNLPLVVLFLSLTSSTVCFSKPVDAQLPKPPPNLFRLPPINPVHRHILPSVNRLPNRELPPPVPAVPYLIVNVSWPRPSYDVSISSPYSQSPHRAEYDTAITFAGATEAFGAGCNATFSRSSSSLLFSGDDVYAPGWEAYRISLSQLQAVQPSRNKSSWPEESSTAAESQFPDNKSLLIYVARQSDFKTQFVINVSAHSASGCVLSHTSLTMEDAPTMTDNCAVFASPAASLHHCPGFGCVLLMNETNSAVLRSEETPKHPDRSISPMPTRIMETPILHASPVAASDPYPPPTTMPAPPPSSAAPQAMHVVVKVSWYTPESAFTGPIRWFSYASSGLKLLGENNSMSYSTCSTTYPGDIVYMPHKNYEPTGDVEFIVNLGRLLDNSSVMSTWFPQDATVTDITLVAFGDWYFKSNEHGSMNVSATLTGPDGKPVSGVWAHVLVENVVPGVSGSCAPKTEVAKFVIRHNRHSGTCHIHSVVSGTEQPGGSQAPIIKSPKPTALFLIDTMETTEPVTTDVESAIFLEPTKANFPPILNSTSILITISWSTPKFYMELRSPTPYRDLETGITLPQYYDYYFVFDTCQYPVRSGPLYTSPNDHSVEGSESFLVDLNYFANRSNSTDRLINIDIIIYASWYRIANYVGNARVSLKLFGPGGAALKGPGSSAELHGFSIGSTDGCKPVNQIAETTVQFDRELKTFGIASLADIYDKMVMIPTERTGSRPGKKKFPPAIKAPSLLITTSWSTPAKYIAEHSSYIHYWDLETGISLPQYHGKWFIVHMCSFPLVNGPIYTSLNNLSATGSESFLVDLKHYVDSSDGVTSNATDRFVNIIIVVYADWFRQRISGGHANISLKLLRPGGQPLNGPGSSAELKGISPGATKTCRPNTSVANITVRFDRKKRSFSIPSLIDVNREPWKKLKTKERTLYETIVKNDNEIVETNVEATLEPSPPVLVFPDVESNGDYYINVTFTWPDDVVDLDSQVWISSLVNGVGCSFDSSSTVLFGGDSTISRGKERFQVLVGKAKKDGRWVDLVDITLAAHWYARDEYNASVADVRVELVNEVNEIIDSAQMEFSPYWHNRVQKPFCGTNKIGRIRVVDNDGIVSIQLGAY